MQLVFSEAGQPRGRGKMERFFGTVNQLLLLDLPGYAPAGSGDVRPVLTLPELDARFRAWLLDTYHTRIHGETKQPPADRWAAGGFLPRMPDSIERLDLLLLTVAKTRKVHPDAGRFQSPHAAAVSGPRAFRIPPRAAFAHRVPPRWSRRVSANSDREAHRTTLKSP